MKKQHITCEIENKVAILQIDNPPANVLSSQVINELSNTLDSLTERDDTKVIIITGKGKFFCAGADIKEIAKINSAKEAKEFSHLGQGLIKKMLNLQKPIIAAINNVCLGGGLELAMACHIRIATDNARLGLPEIALGIIPGFGGTQLLPRLVGRGKAIEMILTGEKVLAKDMKEIGLINHLVPADELIKEAKELAMKIAEKGFIAVSSALKAIMFASSNLPEARDGYVRNFDKDLELETSLFDKIFETEDWREGVSAFLEKRQPKFKDK